MWLSFQKSHSNFCLKSRTPPFPQTSGPEQTLKTKATTKSPSWGCPRLKFQASLTFRKRSPYAPFEKRPPCPCFYCIMETQGPSIKAKVWDSSKRRIFPNLAPCALCQTPQYRCGLEKSAMPSRLTGIANQHNPALRVGLYSPAKYSIMLSVRDSIVYSRGIKPTDRPFFRAVSAVIGPIQATATRAIHF